jgi:hypothetical protein
VRLNRAFQLFGLVLLAGLSLLGSGCSTLASKYETGVVVARRAQIRSSTAVVAADLIEVSRGDIVDVLDSTTVQETGEKWLLVRAQNDEATEGWIEARNILPDDVLEQSRKLANEDKDIPAQATGQLRASSNLRLSPDRSGTDNIIFKLDSGSSFDIVGWKWAPKAKSTESTESDDSPKTGSTQSSQRNRRDAEAPKEPEEQNELWYKVRLKTVTSPAPAGWVFGKQVELTVPSDIIFYRTGREFVAWRRLDEDPSHLNQTVVDKNGAREEKPGSWVILEKSNDPKKQGDSDFDRIYVLGYEKQRQEHYTAYRSPDLKGFLPIKVQGQGDSRSFSVQVMNQSGQLVEAKYGVSRDSKGNLKITPLGESAGRQKK